MAKKGKKARVMCTGCGSKMGKRAVACPECGTARAGTFRPGPTAAKSVFIPASGAPAFLVKAVRPLCSRCSRRSRAGSRHCTACGGAFLSAVKSASPLRDPVRQAMVSEHDPVRREQIWKGAHPEFYGHRGGAA